VPRVHHGAVDRGSRVGRRAVARSQYRASAGNLARVAHGELPSGEVRDLTARERRLLDAMLSIDMLVDGESLRRQAAVIRASSSCGCGCGSIYLVGDTSQAEPGSLPIVEGDVLDDRGEVIGGLLLFAQDGRLDNLEVYSVTDAPLPLPEPERARLRAYRGTP
jgi:hypothetical protein